MIQIKKPKYERDNYCVCCRKPFEDSMAITFSHKDYGDSTIITLCGKCRRELMETLSKADSNSALDHIHNVVRDDAYRRGYEQGKADANHPEIPDSWIPVSEKLPKSNPEDLEYPTVIICLKDGTVELGCFYESTKEWGTGEDFDRLVNPVAWMPLPEPWKGDA